MAGAVVLLSGGVDSSTLLFYVKKRLKAQPIHTLSFYYGQKHKRELEMARWQAEAAGVARREVADMRVFGRLVSGGSLLTDSGRDIPSLREMSASQRDQPPTYVPNRNMVLLSFAAAYAEAHGIRDVYYGAQAQDEYGYWDCTVDFVSRINDILRLNRRRGVRVHAPFVGWRKAEVIRLGLVLGVDYSRTWTCYRGGRKPCGECPSCVERERAFLEAEKNPEKRCGRVGKQTRV